MWEKENNIRNIHEIRSRAMIYFGIGAISKIEDVFADKHLKDVKRITVVTDKTAYKVSGAWEYVEEFLQANKLDYLLFDEVKSNPSTDLIDKCIAKSLEFGSEAIIAIGGGSVIDTGKITGVMINYPDVSSEKLLEYEFFPDKSLPVIAINLTHGTGSETNHFAVGSIEAKNYKPAVGFEEMYPLFSIDDPKLMSTLPLNQTRFVTLDALSHAIEAATCKNANPFAKTLSVKAADLVLRYFPLILEDLGDLEARYYLAFASLLAGISFDNSALHLGHALEHPISAIKPNIPHGLGLATLLPEVLEVIYPQAKEILDEMFRPIKKEGVSIKVLIKDWLSSLGLKETLSDLGFTKNDVDSLVALVYTTPGIKYMLASSPVEISEDMVRRIYTNSL
jgi:alcohol dehydrogenase class IV